MDKLGEDGGGGGYHTLDRELKVCPVLLDEMHEATTRTLLHCRLAQHELYMPQQDRATARGGAELQAKQLSQA